MKLLLLVLSLLAFGLSARAQAPLAPVMRDSSGKIVGNLKLGSGQTVDFTGATAIGLPGGSIAAAQITDASANGRSLLTATNYAAMRSLLALSPGTNIEAWSANLDIFATITPSANTQSLLGAANYAAIKAQLGLDQVSNTTVVSSITAGTGITVSGSTGAITISNAGSAYDYTASSASDTLTTPATVKSAAVVDLTLTNPTTTLSFTGLPAAGSVPMTLILRQDATGGRLASWPRSVSWAGGSPPTLSTLAEYIDVVELLSLNGGDSYFGHVVMTYPAYTVLDNFTRANQSGLGTASSGATWTALIGQWNIAGNAAVTVASQNDCVSTIPSGIAGPRAVLLTLTTNGTSGHTAAGPAVCVVDASNLFFVSLGNSGTNVQLFRRLSGTESLAAQGNAPSLGTNASTQVEVDVYPNYIDVYRDNVAYIHYPLTSGEQTALGSSAVVGLRTYTSSSVDAGGTAITNYRVKALNSF